MFQTLGHFATRYRIAIIIVWLAAAAILTLLAPNLEEVASSDTADMLPADAPFDQADEVYRQTFPASYADSTAVIVFDAEAAGGVLNQEAAGTEAQIDTPVMHYIEDFRAHFTGEAAPDNIIRVITPTLDATALELLIAPDNQVAMVQVEMDTSPTEEASIETLHEMGEWLDEHAVAGVATYQTGSAPIIIDTAESIRTTVDRTIWVTVALVVILLLAIYRSPVSPLIPLFAVTVAYLITRALVAFMGDTVMTITSYANVILVVVMYGAGTDYCLFLISRFREEMADHPGLEEATTSTVHRVGETISSSAGTIFVGFVAMSFAEMGIFNTSGPALALGIVMSLAAGLTFVPALLATLGERAFWPGQARHRSTGRWYEWTSKTLSTYPLVTILVIVAIMVPFSVYGLQQPVNYNSLKDLPDDSEAVLGFERMEESLGAGKSMPLTVVVTGRDPATLPATMSQLSAELYALDNVADVRSLNSPLGQQHRDINGLLRVDEQLGMAGQMLAGFQAGEGEMDMAQAAALLPAIEAFGDYLLLLEQNFPALRQNEDFIALEEMFANPGQLQARQAEVAPALSGLRHYFATEVANPYLLPGQLAPVLAALPAMEDGGSLDPGMLHSLEKQYIADEGTAFKLTVVLAGDPMDSQAMDTTVAIRDILADYHDGEGEAVVSGTPAIVTDMRETMDRDLLRAIGFVLVGIFIVLLLMLRSLVAPLYLIGTVVLSFTCTLGLTNLVFGAVAGTEGLTWYVPFFMFVFLVALGMDYSIFLFGRIKEEVGYHGIREGVHVAVARTGAIITSAGIILAGTFAAMMSGEILGLAELGFAVAVGVLIDTFVVRTMLDPALATFFGRWTWWPGGVPKAMELPADAPGRREEEVPVGVGD